jgi:hypothetical protein
LKTVRNSYTDLDLSIHAKKGPEKSRDTFPFRGCFNSNFSHVGLWAFCGSSFLIELYESKKMWKTSHEEWSKVDDGRGSEGRLAISSYFNVYCGKGKQEGQSRIDLVKNITEKKRKAY